MTDTTLLPHIDEVNQPFWQGCREGILRVQQCPTTGRMIFPPRPVNPWSPRDKAEWQDVCGRGIIWSVIEPHPPLMLDFAELAPYNAIIVELEEDASIRMVGNLVSKPGAAINSIPYDDIHIGTPVRVIFEKINSEITLPRWVRDS
ncbi:MAG: OB-fold domain-containing protein [Halioglobus sp.]|nr:OB-fold domain-containing protein [Halioglobus sp.]